jgi:diguanylate cyclase (GGDEF)-like protein
VKRRTAGESHTRRRADNDSRRGSYKRTISWVFAQWEPVAGGRLLLLATGIVTTLTAPFLQPLTHTWKLLATLTGVMTALLLASFAVPWSRLPRRATIAFPVLVWLAVAATGLGADGLGVNFAGLFSLCFAYLGLTQTTGTIVRLVPLAIACYVGAYDVWTAELAVRLLIAISVWLLLAVLISELVHRQAVLASKLRRAAHTDALTGLANRRDLNHRMALAAPGDTVVICDLDHFKNLNDTQGHAAGDLVLAEFGVFLVTCLRENDYAARYGGEEFALLLPAATMANAVALLDRLREQWAVLQPVITFSAGVATCRPDRAPTQTLAVADRALYAAKAAGRDRYLTELDLEPASMTVVVGPHSAPA